MDMFCLHVHPDLSGIPNEPNLAEIAAMSKPSDGLTFAHHSASLWSASDP